MIPRISKAFLCVFLFILSLFLTGVSSSLAQEGNYPEKTIQFICPYGPGGSTDIALRIWAGILPQYLGQPTVVINRPGASGAIAFNQVKESKPDGYTLMGATGGTNVSLPAKEGDKLPFKWDDLTFVSRIQTTPAMLVVRPDLPIKTVQELIDYVKKNPKKIRVAAAQPADTTSTAPAYLFKLAGVSYDHVTPIYHPGAGQAVLTLLKGDADICYTLQSPLLPHVKAGKLRALLSTIKIKDLPDVPTSAEVGFPELDLATWQGIAGPPGLPDNVVEKLNEAVKKMLLDKSFKRMVQSIGDTASYLGPEEFKKAIKDEMEKRRGIFKELGWIKD